MRTFRAVDPLVIARKPVIPLRRAKAATSGSRDGRNTVSSQNARDVLEHVHGRVLQHMRGVRHIEPAAGL